MKPGTWNLEKEMSNKKLRTRIGLKLKRKMKIANWNLECETRVHFQVEIATGCVKALKLRKKNGKLEIRVVCVISNPNLLISFQHLETVACDRSGLWLLRRQLCWL